MFYPGQPVVCVAQCDLFRWDGVHKRDENLIGSLKVGGCYTIREAFDYVGMPCVRLVEVIRVPRLTYLGMFEAAFDARLFRPLAQEDEGEADVYVVEREEEEMA